MAATRHSHWTFKSMFISLSVCVENHELIFQASGSETFVLITNHRVGEKEVVFTVQIPVLSTGMTIQ